jgi:glycosyltransferase involved in cell wall biosynthesis
MPSINVLHVLNDVGDSSIGRIVQRIIQNLDQQYFNWHVGGLNGLGDLKDEFLELGAQVVDFSEKQNGRPNSLQDIRKYIISNKIDIVHTHTPRAILALYRVLGGKLDIFHVATKHSLFTPSDRRWGLQYTLLDRLGLYLPGHVVAVSQAMFKKISSYPGMGNGVSAICNDIPCEFFYKPDQRDACRTELKLAPESLVIGWTGRIEKVKRIDLLLMAFASVLTRYPNARLILAGDGDLKQKLEEYATQLGISDAVIWTGFRKDIPRLLAAMDIFVQTSVNEGLSLSILEAMAAEKAIIATQVGGTSELLENGKTGVLIPPRMVSSIENAILYLLEHPEFRHEIANAARSFALGHFNAGKMANEYQQLYESLMAQRLIIHKTDK